MQPAALKKNEIQAWLFAREYKKHPGRCQANTRAKYYKSQILLDG
jgi:hypothetical protein